MSDLVEIIFSFDTTGSMYPCLSQVRKNLTQTLKKLFKEMPNLKIGLAAHGDYGDKFEAHGYDVIWHPISNDINSLTTFVEKVAPTYGFGNGGEAYELVLNQAKTQNWSENSSKRILVMIGDEPPHLPSWHENKLNLDWEKEAKELADKGVIIYPIQCLSRRNADFFWRGLAKISSGIHLKLDQFTEIVDLIYAICYKQDEHENYLKALEEDIVRRGKMSRTLDESFRKLTGKALDTSRFTSINPNLIPVDAGRFQILDVDGTTDIKGFVRSNGLPFKIGRGFYQFTKTETIQHHKEIVLRDKKNGDMFTGDQARVLIGAPIGENIRLRPSHLNDYDVFVQSTSVNRKLLNGTKFLYEVDMSM